MKELPPLNDVGSQNCLAFSVDGSKLATGGVVRMSPVVYIVQSSFCSLHSKNTWYIYFDIKLTTEWTPQNLRVA